MSEPLKVISAAKSDQGRRSANDDAVLVDAARGLYVVCDGARGRYGGRTAAEIACQTLEQESPRLADAVGDALGPHAEQAVETALLAAHNRILSAQRTDPELKGMTSTVVLALHRGNKLLLTHMGDSRIFLFRDLHLHQMTRDHNLENFLQDNPSFKPKMKLSGKTLVRALGLQTTKFKAEHKLITVKEGDVVLLSSDGLSDSVPLYTLREIAASVEVCSADDVVASLIRAAVSHGSMDNVSAILLQATSRVVAGPRTEVFDIEAIDPGKQALVLGWLAFLDGPKKGQLVPLEASVVIGADPNCRIVVQENFVSARHAEVFRTTHGFMLRDMDSTNGTFINNIRTKGACLVDGDVIRVGQTEMVFKSHAVE